MRSLKMTKLLRFELEMVTGRAARGPGRAWTSRPAGLTGLNGPKDFSLWYIIVCGNACGSMFPASVPVLFPSFCPIAKVQWRVTKNSEKIVGNLLECHWPPLAYPHEFPHTMVYHTRAYSVRVSSKKAFFITIECLKLSWHFLKFNF